MKIRSFKTCIMSSLPCCIFRFNVFGYVTLVSFFLKPWYPIVILLLSWQITTYLPIKDKPRFQLNKQLWKRVNFFWSTIVASFIGWCDYQWRACLGIEPRTSRSQSENHTTRPTGNLWLRCIPYLSDVSIHEKESVVVLLTARFYWNPHSIQ